MLTTPLPPLPLLDGCLFMDNSSWIEGMSTCYRYLQYRSLNLRVLAAEKAALNFGSIIHSCLEHRHRKYRNNAVGPEYYNDIAELLTKFYAEHPVPADDWRTMNFTESLIRRYNERYAQEEFSLLEDDKGEVLVELPFALHLHTHTMPDDTPIRIMYSGRIDMPVAIGGQVLVLDHKTSSGLSGQFWDDMRMTAQQRGYVWATQKLIGRPVAGYIINGIRTKDVPGYVLAGKSTTRNGKSYSADTWWQETFQRERFIMKPGEIDEWENNTIDLIEEFFWHYERGFMPMKTKWCSIYGRCPYYDVCRLEVGDRERMLASGAYADNVWSPLRKPIQP